jgi:hypothetical protein
VETLHPGLADPVGRLIIQRRPLRLPLSRGRSHPKARCRRDTLIQRGPSGREERKHRIRVLEIDDEYKVPQSIEAYERHKKEGAVVISLFGTPQTYALTRKLTEDRIPGSSPGFGRADAPDGTRYPYIFPIAASYWSQAAASIKYAKDQLGALEGKKIAYLFFDNSAGREPIPVLEDLAELRAERASSRAPVGAWRLAWCPAQGLPLAEAMSTLKNVERI